MREKNLVYRDIDRRFYLLVQPYYIAMADRNKLKITVLKRLDPEELFDELPVNEKDWMVACKLFEDNQEIIVEEDLRMPEGFCPGAWQTIYHFIRTLGFGGNMPYFDEKGVAVTCCADGLRPVIFKIERIE
jgi:uncharacterized repeat protein (TIGR04076 family)